jgi:5'-nucleotidase
LQRIDDSIASDATVDAVARRWVDTAFDGFRREGFAPEAIVATIGEPLDGRESTVRNRSGRLTDLIVAALAREAGNVDVALFNGGSVRIDDVVPPGPVTEYDVIRILPFGGRAVKATFDGALLARVLDTGVNNQGLGGYLHVLGARSENGAWRVGGKPIVPTDRYSVVLPEFLLSGGEINMGYLTRAHPQVRDVQALRDIRHLVIDELRRQSSARQEGSDLYQMAG